MRGPLEEIQRRGLYHTNDNRGNGSFYFSSTYFQHHFIRLDVSSNDWNEISLIDAFIENGHMRKYKKYDCTRPWMHSKIIVPFIYGCARKWQIIHNRNIEHMLDEIAANDI